MLASVIIPVATDRQNNSLISLLNALDKQTLRNFEVILVIGDNRQGRAINTGVNEAGGKWIITMDDDTQVSDDNLLEKLIAAMETDNSIGLGGSSCIIPDSATRFQKKAMQQIQRRFFPIQKHNVESDFVQHPCLILRRELFVQIGGEDEQLIRGLDPVLRDKIRREGKKVSILANTSIVHLLPNSLFDLLNMYRRNGRGSAFAQRFFPDRVLELTDGYDRGDFVRQRPLSYRCLRRFFSLLNQIIHCRWIRVATDITYSIGWIEGRFAPDNSRNQEPPKYAEGKTQKRPNFVLRRITATLSQ